MQLVKEFVNIYINKVFWPNSKLNLEQTHEYFKTLIDKDNIIYIEKDDKIVGYLEFWCVSLRQLHRIKDDEDFHIADENITYGNFCYINDIWIDESHRGNGVIKKLKSKLLDKAKHCYYLAGVKQDKRDEMRIKSVIRR